MPPTRAEAATKNLPLVLDAARAAVDAEWQLSDRLDEKARGQATLAGAWFAVTQAVAAAALAAGHVSKGWPIGLAVGLGLQAGAVLLLFRASAKVWGLRTERGVGANSVRAMQADVEADPTAVAHKVIDFYCELLDKARAANRARATAFDNGRDGRSPSRGCAVYWWWWVLALGVVEVAAALLSHAIR